MIRLKGLTAVSFLVISSLSQSASAALDPKVVNLVQSVPVETELRVAGMAQAEETWIDMIRGAKKTIDLCQMYLSSVTGSSMDRVIGALEAAGGRGVKIRLILTKSMLQNDAASLERLKKIPGLQFAAYGVGFMHAKYWIIDGREIYVGSQNLDYRSLTHIHELGVRIRDPKMAAQLASAFSIDWNIAQTGALPTTLPDFPRDTLVGVELVASPATINPNGMRRAIDALRELIASARKQIRIQVMDYSPEGWTEIEDAIRAAAGRGVKVQMVVSHWNTEPKEIGYIKALSQVANVDLRICTIPEHSSGFMPYSRVTHSKYMTVDGEVIWVGTSNWSKSYFYGARNVELIFKDSRLTSDGDAVFEKVWNAAYTEKVDVNRDYPKPRKF